MVCLQRNRKAAGYADRGWYYKVAVLRPVNGVALIVLAIVAPEVPFRAGTFLSHAHLLLLATFEQGLG